MQLESSRSLGRSLITGAVALCILCGSPSGPAHATLRRVPEMYPSIQSAIYAAEEGDSVLIAPGTYRGPENRNIELAGKDIVVTSSAGPEQTIIDCENAGRGFRVHQWESPAARIEKLTIVNGNAFDLEGGGILCDIASPTISDCRILSSSARFGGGLALLVFWGIVDRCVIAGNYGSDGGGGIATMYTDGVAITNCVITGNMVGIAGGGVAFLDNGGSMLRGCTVAGNVAADAGGGVYTADGASITRSAIWGNCALRGDELFVSLTPTSLLCSDIDTSGVVVEYASVSYDAHCIFTDPLFCAPSDCGQTTAGDWMLSENSPCLSENSPCGIRIGALDAGCGVAYPPGACCLPGGTCVAVSEYVCSMQQGTYQGNGTSCQPDPCQPTAVERTSWGRIKAAYR